MTINELSPLVNRNLSVREISEELHCSQSNVRYWISKHGLTRVCSFYLKGKIEKNCPRCNNKKPLSDFYRRRGVDGGSVYCKPCTNNQSIERQRRLKLKCLEYLGKSCSKCGYDKCFGALEFHHLIPSEKEIEISTVISRHSFEGIKKELDKCVVLCSNCHKETHYSSR